MASIQENIAGVRERIARAAARVGRDPSEITLVAVTKTVPPDRIREAIEAGVRDVGENYYQEAREKLPLFGSDIRWHFIGHLQANKAKYVPGKFALVHSVDSADLARELARRAQAAGVDQAVLVEVKLDFADTKHGIQRAAALDLAAAITGIDGLGLQGFMGMAPYGIDPESARPYFAALRVLFERLPTENRRTLSMGMTADFEVAIEEGATLVRIGTAIFGAR